MASNRLVSHAKSALAQHYKSRPQDPGANVCDYEIWAREFAELLADYDFTVSGKRDDEVKAWIDDTENTLEPFYNPSWLRWGSAILRRQSRGYIEAKMQDPANGSELEHWEDMRRYFAVPSWDYLVDTIHRVERTDSGEILVYFTSRHGEKIREAGSICKVRCPKKLLAFYEQHLSWDNNIVTAQF